jgi:hypothetical protein
MTLDSSNAENHNKSVIIPVEVANREFRIHLSGSASGLAGIRQELPALAREAVSEEGFLTALMPRLAVHRVMLADTLDLSTPYVKESLVALLHAAAHTKTAEQAWVHIRYLLSEATDSELDELIQSENLTFVRGFVNAVLDDLDERGPTERAALRAELPEAVSYLLLNE